MSRSMGALFALVFIGLIGSCVLPRGSEAAEETIQTLTARVEALEQRVCVLEGGTDCVAPSPSPTVAPTPSAVVVASPSPTPSATPSPVTSPSASPTASPSPSPTSSTPPPSSPTPAPTAAPTPSAAPVGSTVTLEAQAWWNRDGILVPSAPGHHIHVAATIPTPGRIVNGRVDIPVDITLHDQVAGPNWIRWSDGSNVLGSVALDGFNGFSCVTHDGFTDCKRRVVLPVDFSRFATGLRELRISVNVPDEQPDVSGAQRMFNSTGWQVAVRSLTPEYRSGPEFVEARGWYTDHEYQNARLTTGVESVRAGGTIGVRLGPGSGGRPTTYSLVTLDPDMHRHFIGRRLVDNDGPLTTTVRIPSDLSPGVHKLTLVASDGKNAGVLVVPFRVE